jgi:hypothetical protein
LSPGPSASATRAAPPRILGVVLTTPELVRQSRATYRQVDCWVRDDVLVPVVAAMGSGTPRRFSDSEIPVARLVADLAALGAGRDVLRQAAAWARMFPLERWTSLAFVTEDGDVSFSVSGPCWVVDLAACVAERRDQRDARR